MDVSVKISEEEVILVDGLKSNLRQRGIRVTKKQVIDESIKLALEHKDALIKRLRLQDNTREKTERFLKNKARFDFGRDWQTEIDET